MGSVLGAAELYTKHQFESLELSLTPSTESTQAQSSEGSLIKRIQSAGGKSSSLR